METKQERSQELSDLIKKGNLLEINSDARTYELANIMCVLQGRQELEKEGIPVKESVINEFRTRIQIMELYPEWAGRHEIEKGNQQATPEMLETIIYLNTMIESDMYDINDTKIIENTIQKLLRGEEIKPNEITITPLV